MDDPNEKIYRTRPEMTPERVQICREWIARRRAEIDQKKKEFEDQYPFNPAMVNRARLDALEAKEFWVDLHEWELDEMLKGMEDNEL